MPKPMRRKNPGENVLPHMDPAYPIRPLVNVASKLKATVVVLPVPGERKFVASVLEDLRVNVSGSTRKSAQDAAMNAFVEKHATPKPPRRNPRLNEEDERDIELIRQARKEPRVSWQLVKRRAGL